MSDIDFRDEVIDILHSLKFQFSDGVYVHGKLTFQNKMLEDVILEKKIMKVILLTLLM